MNSKSYFFIILFIFVSSQLWAGVPTDPTMNAIKDYTYQTAEHTAKGAYDHWALGISLFAFIVGAITLGFTYLTYKSQKKTEINTRRWNSKQERTNLRYMFLKLMDAASVLSYLEGKRVQTKGSFVPEISVLEELILDVNELHADDFFGDGVDYNKLQDLRRGVIKYNTVIKNTIHELQSLSEDYTYPMTRFYCDCIENCYELIRIFLESYDYMFTNEDMKELHENEQMYDLRECPLPVVSDLGLYRYIRKNIPLNSQFKDELSYLRSDFRDLVEYCLKLKNGAPITSLKEERKVEFLYYFREAEKVTDISLLFPYMLMIFTKINRHFDDKGIIPNNKQGIYPSSEEDSKNKNRRHNYQLLEGINSIETSCPSVLEPGFSIIGKVFSAISLTEVVLKQILINDLGSIRLNEILERKKINYYEGIPQIYTPADGGTCYYNVSEDILYDVIGGKKEKLYIPIQFMGIGIKKGEGYYGLFKNETHDEWGEVKLTKEVPLEYLNVVSKLVLTNNNEKVLNTAECRVELEGVREDFLRSKDTGIIDCKGTWIILKILSIDKYNRKIKF